MKKLLATIILTCLSLTATAKQPDWVSINDVADEALESESLMNSKMVYLFQRCAAQQLAMSSLVGEASADLERTFTLLSSTLTQGAALVRIMLAQSRGVDVDAENVGSQTLEVVQNLFGQYMEWANSNYLSDGAYYEDDLEFQAEITICRKSAELAATLMKRIGSDQ